MYNYGESGDSMAKSIFDQSKTKPENVLVIRVDHGQGYSIYVNEPADALMYGIGVKPYFNWRYPKKIDTFAIDYLKCDNIESIINQKIQESSENYDAIWVMDGSKATVVSKINHK